MDTILGYDPVQLARTERLQRLELALTVGGSVGLATMLLLRMAGRERAANMLAFGGVLVGGVLGVITVAQGRTRFQ